MSVNQSRRVNRLIFRLMVVGLLLSLASEEPASAADTANRTLIGNRAVRRELGLSKRQQETIDRILTEMEDEIQTGLKAALAEKPLAKDAAESIEEKIAGEAIARHRTRVMEVLDDEQANRFWQIGAQSAGPAVFNNNRVRRVLKLSDEQRQVMSKLSEKMTEQVQQLALDVAMPISEVKEKADLAQQNFMRDLLALLTEQQRRDFDRLLGEPFDRELLRHSDGTKPRSLTFVFGLSGQNPWQLAVIPAMRQTLALSDEQLQQIESLAKQADKDLTKLRLATLNGAAADFSDLPLKEKQRVVRAILDGAAASDVEMNQKVWQILDQKQCDRLQALLVQTVGARAIASASIAEVLKLSAEQRASFAKLNAEFEKKTAVMRVVRSHADFDHKAYDDQFANLEKETQALLTDQQRRQLETLKQSVEGDR